MCCAIDQPTVLGCLVSGSGRTVSHLHELCRSGRIHGRVGIVIATRESVQAVARCRADGIHTLVMSGGDGLDDRIDQALTDHGVRLVCLCGYMQKFRVDAWRGRCLNVHPALLPRHGGAGMWGLRVHRAVLDAGDRESGCTIHEVDEEYDHGPPLLQRRCPVLPGDTPEILAQRVFEEELAAWPEAITRWHRASRAD
ncbi:MAG: formyltransferase family protein [Planctomycetota bacterium]|nr:formyltransferase family protein [Planctomycetota bacterium]MDA1104972.1 formyltransferase family protein [Planctomycetota bacterium]